MKNEQAEQRKGLRSSFIAPPFNTCQAIVNDGAKSVHERIVNGQRRHDNDHVSQWPQKDTLVASRSTNHGSRAPFGGKGSFALLILDQLNPGHESLLANVANMGQIRHSPEMLRQAVNL